MKNMIISHIKPIKGIDVHKWPIQTNEEHSRGVSKLAAEFAHEIGFDEVCAALGLLHDKGKEQLAFQRYIRTVTEYDVCCRINGKVHHAYVGALMVKEIYPQLPSLLQHSLSHIILGHHGGLRDQDELELKLQETIPLDVSPAEPIKDLKWPTKFQPNSYEFNHWVRMLYSCLVDADYLDTEAFMDKESSNLRQSHETLEELLPKLESYLTNLKVSATHTPLNTIRNKIQERCIETSTSPMGFFSLTVPTGGGKTLSSLIWAMRHAIKHGLKRIIIAIPYTSIIVQTAETLRRIFGVNNVLEHHSNFDSETISDKKTRLQMTLAAENWDYPIVVTTNVQLFESMYANKPSRCRKLHNIGHSVLILDEVQTLPLEHLQPIVDALKTYQHLFGTSILFTTASQPILTNDKKLKLNGITEITEIIPNNYNLHQLLRRVNLVIDKTSCSYDELSERLCKESRFLCVVNTRKIAQKIYNNLPPSVTLFHLSRMMCPAHICKTISEIKQALRNEKEKEVRVVSTQLIEAGVDIDFPVVYRQEAGLDSVLQAAGRCNREGLLPHNGTTYLFMLKGEPLLKGAAAPNNARNNIVGNPDWFAPETMNQYFANLYYQADFDKNDLKSKLYQCRELQFRTAAEAFRLIEEKGTKLIVNYGESVELLAQLVEKGPNHNLMKKLNQYAVTLHDKDFKELVAQGAIEEVLSGIYFLHDRIYYDSKTGIKIGDLWLDEILTI